MIPDNKKTAIKVFVSEVSEDVKRHHNILSNVLKRAGMEVVLLDAANLPAETDKKRTIRNYLNQVDCSIHILGNQYGGLVNGSGLSYPELAFSEAKRYCDEYNNDFKLFVWQPYYSQPVLDRQQEKFVTSIKNSILHNVILSYQDSPVLLVEDINIIVSSQKTSPIATTATEVFFIYNELDEEPASSIVDMLGDILKVHSLKIEQNTEDQAPYLIEQVKNSKMVVVYFKWTADWAVSFVQQLWKITGGASSHTPILFIGDANHKSNQNKTFVAPKVSSLLVAEELMALEIKVQFDKMEKEL